MNFYFCGSITGGREKVEDYKRIVEKLKEYGHVLTEHVASSKLGTAGEEYLSRKEIYDRDVEWLRNSDFVIAEVSIPSLGMGYELGFAESIGKKIICFYDINSKNRLSAMIEGNENFEVVKYTKINEVLDKLDKLLKG